MKTTLTRTGNRMPIKSSKGVPRITATSDPTRYVIACVSDIHAGGTTALAPERIALDDGGEYVASKAQRWLWECWENTWKRVEEVRREKPCKFFAIFNGDLVDGYHHGTTEIISANPNPQAAVVNAALAIPLGMQPDHIVVVRGTEAHVGKSASAEERIADGLRRDRRPVIIDPDTKTSSWWHFRAELGGVLIDVTHHGRTGQREHTRGSAAVLHAHDILLAHAKSGDRHPDLCLRGHHHKFNDSGDSCPVRVVTSGAYQLGTSYVKKIAADSMADIGGLVVVIENGKANVEKVQFKPNRGAVWRP